jgi:hypothetical protein
MVDFGFYTGIADYEGENSSLKYIFIIYNYNQDICLKIKDIFEKLLNKIMIAVSNKDLEIYDTFYGDIDNCLNILKKDIVDTQVIFTLNQSTIDVILYYALKEDNLSKSEIHLIKYLISNILLED